MITLHDVQTARQRIAGRVARTPLATSATLSARLGCQVYLKLELFQKTGSFKVRGAFNKALSIPAEKRGRGLVAVSGGNHAQAVAYVATQLGLPSIILMPQTTPRNYLEGTRGYGAQVVLVPNSTVGFQKIPDYEKEGWTFVHPFDDPLVMAGQGTLGLEIAEDLPEVTDVIVSIGGGGSGAWKPKAPTPCRKRSPPAARCSSKPSPPSRARWERRPFPRTRWPSRTSTSKASPWCRIAKQCSRYASCWSGRKC